MLRRGPALKKFFRLSRDLYGKGRSPGEAEVTLLELLNRVRLAGAPSMFENNLSIIADDIFFRPKYWSEDEIGADVRLRLGRLRSDLGQDKAKTLEQLGISVVDATNFKARRDSWLTRHLPGAVGAALRIIRPQTLGRSAFPEIVARWARSPRLRGMLMTFCQRTKAMVRESRVGKSPDSIWQTALQCTDQDELLAAELLGAIVGQKKPLRFVEKVVAPEHPEAAAAIPVFVEAQRAYFRLAELHQISLNRNGRSCLYPKGNVDRSGKYWHFYASMLLAMHLRRQGFGPLRIRIALSIIAVGYELTTIPKNVSMDPRAPLKNWSSQALDSWADLRRQAAGVRYARQSSV